MLLSKNLLKLVMGLFLIILLVWKVLPLFELTVVDNNMEKNINANVYFYTENEEVYNSEVIP